MVPASAQKGEQESMREDLGGTERTRPVVLRYRAGERPLLDRGPCPLSFEEEDAFCVGTGPYVWTLLYGRRDPDFIFRIDRWVMESYLVLRPERTQTLAEPWGLEETDLTNAMTLLALPEDSGRALRVIREAKESYNSGDIVVDVFSEFSEWRRAIHSLEEYQRVGDSMRTNLFLRLAEFLGGKTEFRRGS